MIIKCKMCGGDLRIEEGTTVAECEYCGTKQTVPNADNEKKIKLFERANRLRAACEFDKAAGVYESIVADFDTEAEAYWGLILCKFGIEYVDDPATGNKVPTCHRSSFDSVLEDPNFELVMENSDAISRKVYRDEAKAIEELRRSIIEVSSKEEPYDVFISYKELDASGERTIDSVIAQDIYKELTNEGYRVFFSRISLESKLGVEYEPYIFAALNSARVMIVVGTDYDNFNAVWVKNEWSRYLALIASGQKKTLIPCFKNIDAYDMPREFNKLAAQDMGKVGAMQDLLRGVEKLLGKNEGSAAAHSDSKSAAEPLLTRAFMFLEDGNWKEADKYCEKVLDLEPKNALAYVGKLMVELHVKTQQNLSDCEEPFDNYNNYKKAIRFADNALKSSLTDTITIIKTRILERKYMAALLMQEKAKTDSDYTNAVKMFNELGDYKDSPFLANECQNAADELIAEERYKTAISMLENAISEQDLLAGVKILDMLGDYRDSVEQKAKYEESWRSRKEFAMSIWAEYCSVKDRIHTITDEIEKRTSPAEKLKKDVKKAKEQLQEVERQSDKLASFEIQLKTTEQQLAKANSELDSLGMLAFSKKKELAARVKDLSLLSKSISDKISQTKAFINGAGSPEMLQASIDSNEIKVDECLNSVKFLNDELALLQEQLMPTIHKLENRQIIAILAQDEKKLPLLFDEYYLAIFIKTDTELQYMIKNSKSFHMLPKDKQSGLLGSCSFDAEAAYYQACQAMEEAKSMDDIKWARGEFVAIRWYKDSTQRLEKCEEMIKSNTYKYN